MYINPTMTYTPLPQCNTAFCGQPVPFQSIPALQTGVYGSPFPYQRQLQPLFIQQNPWNPWNAVQQFPLPVQQVPVTPAPWNTVTINPFSGLFPEQQFQSTASNPWIGQSPLAACPLPFLAQSQLFQGQPIQGQLYNPLNAASIASMPTTSGIH